MSHSQTILSKKIDDNDVEMIPTELTDVCIIDLTSNEEVPSQSHEIIADDQSTIEEMDITNCCERQENSSDEHITEPTAICPKTHEEIFEEEWEALQDDSFNFNKWINLMSMINKNIDVNKSRNAFRKFLSLYPVCSSYWVKYAKFEKKNNNLNESEKILQEGLSITPFSLVLWIYYMGHLRSDRSDQVDFIRSEYERCLRKCGIHFKSDALWTNYISWEINQSEFQNAYDIYIRLLRTPTQLYLIHFFNFLQFVSDHPPDKMLRPSDYIQRRSLVLRDIRANNIPEVEINDYVLNADENSPTSVISEIATEYLKRKIIDIGYEIHKKTIKKVLVRRNFESNIQRDYFDTNVLGPSELQNWRDYIDFEKNAGKHHRIVFVYERCLISCALYEEFWLSYLDYMEPIMFSDSPLLNDLFKRAYFFHPHSLKLSLKYSDYEENKGCVENATNILKNIETSYSSSIEVANRRLKLLRINKTDKELIELWEYYLRSSKSKVFVSNIAVNYARYIWKQYGVDRAINIINNTIKEKNISVEDSSEIYKTLVKLIIDSKPRDKKSVIKIFNEILSEGCTTLKLKVIFAKKKLKFIESHTFNYEYLHEATNEYKYYLNLLNSEIAAEENRIMTENLEANQMSSLNNQFNFDCNSSDTDNNH